MQTLYASVHYLMQELKVASTYIDFPPPEVLQRLALSDSGFVFDPLSGTSYTVNDSGLALLRILQKESLQHDMPKVTALLRAEFDVDALTAEQDVQEFASVLRGLLK